MLLPSALSCDGGRALPSSSTSMLLSPVPRHATLSIPQVALFAHTPAIDREDASLRTSAVEGIFMTCKKLHQILSLEPPRSASPSVSSSQLSATTQTHNAFNRAIASPLPSTDATGRDRVSQSAPASSSAPNRLAVPSATQAPQTPSPRKSNVLRVPKTPMRRNKRRQSDVDSDEDDGFYHIPVQSQKRPRLATVPVSTINQSARATKFNRRCRQLRIDSTRPETLPQPVIASTSNALQLSALHQPSPHQERLQMEMEITPSAQADNSARDWSNAEDRLLVEMVLQKMRLTPRDWADCARSLGRDPRAVGNRWEMIVESLMGGAGAAPKRKMLEDSERR
ncbi:hypothetical protein BGX38DRAFT_1143867 [Terfezia claveryi]|nr:hypothetical protein BGX38DRAFT_1143867 [Terfezia claveryi]